MVKTPAKDDICIDKEENKMKKIYTAPELESQSISAIDIIAYSELGSDPAKKDTIDDFGPGSDPAKDDIIEIV